MRRSWDYPQDWEDCVPISCSPKVLLKQTACFVCAVLQRVARLTPRFSRHTRTICLTLRLPRLRAGLFLFQRLAGFWSKLRSLVRPDNRSANIVTLFWLAEYRWCHGRETVARERYCRGDICCTWCWSNVLELGLVWSLIAEFNRQEISERHACKC